MPLSSTPLVRKLERIMTLSEDEKQAATRLPMTIRAFQPHQDIVPDGDHLSQCCLIVGGWACRYRLLSDGHRQITAFNTTGDMPDLYGLHIPVMDHGLAALTASSVGFVPHKDMREFIAAVPNIAAVFWRETFTEMSTLREWIVGIGSRSALDRMAHLLCELYLKVHKAGLADGYCCDLPIKQQDLADALGLSCVHVNRILQELRGRGLITLRSGRLIIHDWDALAEIASLMTPAPRRINGSFIPSARVVRQELASSP